MSYKPYINTPDGVGAYQKLTIGNGIDTSKTSFAIDATTGSYLRNVSARNYPALSSREGRKEEYNYTVTTKRGIGTRENDTLLLVDGDIWKYDNAGTITSIQTFSSTGKTNRCEFAQFDTSSILYSIVTDGTNRYVWDGTTATSLAAYSQTATTLVTSFHNRLFWASGRTLYASAFNDITDYTTLENNDYDSWSGTISQTMDDIVAICNYNDHLQMFTPNGLFEIYGTKPSTYQVVPIFDGVGCVGQWALVTANGYLYFADRTGIYRYNGASYTKISSQVDGYINDINTTYESGITLSADTKYLYAAIPYGSTATANNLVLKYDFEKGIWFVETGAFIDMTSFPKQALGLDSTGKIWTMNEGTADDPYTGSDVAVSWDWISKAFTGEQIKSRNTVSEIWVAIYLPSGSTATASFSTSHSGTTGFTTAYTFSTSSSIQKVSIPIGTLANASWYRIRFTGTGPCDIHFLDIHLRSQT